MLTAFLCFIYIIYSSDNTLSALTITAIIHFRYFWLIISQTFGKIITKETDLTLEIKI